MTRNNLISLFFLALLGFILYQIGLIFRPFLEAIFWAAILTFAFYPIYKKLRAIFSQVNDTLNALLMTVIIFFIVVPPVVALVINFTGQAIELYQSATTYIRDGHLQKLIEQIRHSPFIERIQHNFFQWEPMTENATDWILNTSRSTANFAIAQVGTITKNLFFVVLNAALMFCLIFIFLRDGSKIYNFIYRVAPLEDDTRRLIFGQISETFAAVIRGQLFTSLVQSIVAGVIYALLGIPGYIFFAGATFIATLIPVIGAAGVWVPLTIYLVTLQAYGRATILVILGVGFISLIDNVIKPALIGEKTRLPYFLLFLGILGGLQVYGLMGVFLAPAVLSLFFALIKIFQEKYVKPAL